MIYFRFFAFFFFFSSVFSTTVQIYGSAALGYYYMNVFIGSPPQLQTLILDTGSWLTSFPCNGIKEYLKYVKIRIFDRMSSG